MNNEKLIEWCLENLQFYNCPDEWEETYIVDILNGYQGTATMYNGHQISYSKIRSMFEEE